MSRKIEPRNDWENHFKWNKGLIVRVLLLTVILKHPVYLPSVLEPSVPGDGLESSCFPLLGNQPSLRAADEVWGFDMMLYTISWWVWQVEWFLQIWNDHFCSNLQIKRGTVQPCHFSEKNIGWLNFFCRALSTDQLLHLQPSSSSSSAGGKADMILDPMFHDCLSLSEVCLFSIESLFKTYQSRAHLNQLRTLKDSRKPGTLGTFR